MSASFCISHRICPYQTSYENSFNKSELGNCRNKRRRDFYLHRDRSSKFGCWARVVAGSDLNGRIFDRISAQRVANNLVGVRVVNELHRARDDEEEEEENEEDRFSQLESNFTNYGDDPMVGKLRSQLGVLHPIPSPPIKKNVLGLFVFFFFVGLFFDKIWSTARRKIREFYGFGTGGQRGAWPEVPTSFALFLENDLQRKESVEWVNMVLGKLWKVYRNGIENWIVGLLQPVIDNLDKPDYVERVFIKQFSLGDEPLSVRSVERRTSRRVNDLQYQIGLRYTGGARMLLMLSLKFSIIPIVVPVGVRDFDIDGELWVKLRLIPTEPWIGAVQWAFVSLPKIKFELSPFRLFNLMAIPVLSMFLTKLLTEDLPRLFVRPKKIVLDFQKGKAVGPVPIDSKSHELHEGNKDFVGELSVTLVDARKLFHVFYGKTDPYVILRLGNQIIRSKRNSQTTVIGPPGEPIWNQDFHMLVANHRKQKLLIQVKDSLGFTDFTVGSGEVDLGSLKDTVPTDRVVTLRGGLRLFGKGTPGEILLRLTYKAYVEDEDDDKADTRAVDLYTSDDDVSDSYDQISPEPSVSSDKESFMDLLAALIVSEEFQGIVASETGNNKTSENGTIPGLLPNSKPISTAINDTSKSRGLVWFAVITSILVLIALTLDGSSLFNP